MRLLLAQVGDGLGIAGNLPNGVIGSAYSATLRGVGGTGRKVLTLVSTDNPDGLTLTDNGDSTASVDIASVATAGTFSVQVRVKDAERQIRLRTLTFSVEAAPYEISGSLDDAGVDIPYSETLQISGGISPDTIVSAEVPDWMSLSINGTRQVVAAGIPDAELSGFTLSITCEDSEGRRVTHTQTMNVIYCDPYFANVAALLHFDTEANGATTITDEVGADWESTDGDVCRVHSSGGVDGSGALEKTSATGDTIATADRATFPVGSDDFTIEMWVYNTSLSSGAAFISQGVNPASEASKRAFQFIRSAAAVQFIPYHDGSSNAITVAGPGNMSLNTWHHIAAVRNGTSWRVYLDGVSGTEVVSSTTIFDSDLSINIGWSVEGFIDGVRVTTGVARYTGESFTPPEYPFPTQACP